MDTIKGWKKPYQKYDFWMSKSNSEIVKVVFDEKYSIWTVRTEHKSIFSQGENPAVYGGCESDTC
jgi:hypothetical protein